jgi:peptidoglycan lytic transglycosylase D
MLKATIRRFFGRRKIETASIVVIAAASAITMARMDALATPAQLAAPSVQYLAAAAASVKPPVEVAEARAELPALEHDPLSSSTMDLPNLEHPRVQSWIRRFTTDQRGSYATYLSRMSRYDDMISGKLADRGMPQGLIYLAMIESGFNPKARSPVAASGLWQFMGATGKQYGLTVNRRMDERNNPSRSTDAALKYLSDLHKQFGSWYLAAAAYNVGPGRVARVMKQVTGSTKGTDADYYRISSRLPQETRDYVPKMIAAARIGNDPAKYGFSAN